MRKTELIWVIIFCGLCVGTALAGGIETSKREMSRNDIVLKGVYGERAGFKIDDRLCYIKEGKEVSHGIILEKISEGGSVVFLSTPDGKKVVRIGESLSGAHKQREANIHMKELAKEGRPISQKEELKFKEYKIEKNDSLWKIAAREYGDGNKWKKIYNYNKDKIKNPSKLKKDLTILIPLE